MDRVPASTPEDAAAVMAGIAAANPETILRVDPNFIMTASGRHLLQGNSGKDKGNTAAPGQRKKVRRQRATFAANSCLPLLVSMLNLRASK